MANTPQAKKRIRRNDRRAEINGARVGRIRTFVKKVEAALASGDKTAATAALAPVQPELAARRRQGRAPQEHREPQVLAPDQARRRARLIASICIGVSKARREHIPAGFLLSVRDACATDSERGFGSRSRTQRNPRFAQLVADTTCETAIQYLIN